MPCAGCCALYLRFNFSIIALSEPYKHTARQGYFFTPAHIVHKRQSKTFPVSGQGKGYTAMQSKAANQPLTIETGQALANTGRWETRQELPVETEILIPDYLPAVFKIVKCLLEPVIMQNSVADRR